MGPDETEQPRRIGVLASRLALRAGVGGLTEERGREKQRTEKLLESAAIKISSVLTDLHGVTGRDIMDHLIAGERNPKVLAQLARRQARRKISQLEAPLEGAEFQTERATPRPPDPPPPADPDRSSMARVRCRTPQ